MNPDPHRTCDDLAAVRALLAPADPVPDSVLAREDVLAARASVGLGRAEAPSPSTRRLPRLAGPLVAAGAVAVLSVATLIALVAVPAGQEDDTFSLATGPGARAISSAYSATADSGTARGLLTVEDGTDTLTVTGIGSFEGAARAEITVAEGPGEPPASITVVRTGDATYARMPDGANPLDAGKPWVSVDAATLARLTQLALGDLGAQVTGAPLDALAYLKAVSGDVQVVGQDTTRGEPTTRHRGTIDPRKVAEQLPAASRPETSEAAGSVGPIPVDMWIDDQGRLRKMVLAVDRSSIEGARSASPSGVVTVTLELWDFGTPVDVTAPPADQVVKVDGLLGGFLDGARHP